MTYEHLDERLLNALLDDGRASHRSLGRTLDVSVTTVSNHLTQLEEAGHLRGFVPVINYGAFGYDVTAISHLKVEGIALPSVTDWLADQDQFIGVYEVTGDHDVVLIGRFSDTDDMNRHIKLLLGDPNINESNTSVVLNAVRDYEQFKLPVSDD